jgi:hypothetical protein
MPFFFVFGFGECSRCGIYPHDVHFIFYFFPCLQELSISSVCMWLFAIHYFQKAKLYIWLWYLSSWYTLYSLSFMTDDLPFWSELSLHRWFLDWKTSDRLFVSSLGSFSLHHTWTDSMRPYHQFHLYVRKFVMSSNTQRCHCLLSSVYLSSILDHSWHELT